MKTHMTLANLDISTNPYADMQKEVDIKDVPGNIRYDEMAKDFYSYVMKNKENPFTYEHELLVHKVLAEVCRGYNNIRN